MQDTRGTNGDMALDNDALRARLATTPVTDVRAALDLFHASSEAVRERPTDVEASILARRIERLTGLAVRAGQMNGQVAKQGDNTGSKLQLDTHGNQLTAMYAMADGVSDEMFEHALSVISARPVARGRVKGIVSRQGMLDQLKLMKEQGWVGDSPPPPPVKPTPKGRRTIKYMQIQTSALAAGVKDISPGEVDAVTLAAEIEQIRDDIGHIRAFLRRVLA